MIKSTPIRFSMQALLWVTALVAIWASFQMPQQTWARIGIEFSMVLFVIGPLIAVCRCTQRAYRAFWIGAAIPPAILAATLICLLGWIMETMSKLHFGRVQSMFWINVVSRLSCFWIPASLLTGLFSLAIYSLPAHRTRARQTLSRIDNQTQ